MAIGIGIGLPFRRVSANNYPTQNLQGRYIQLVEGTDLINTRGGISIPYISGVGLNQIFDFSVLNDDRFDKGSYVGNAFGLPETYNFPYVGIYYDAASEATRHYWKMTDFAYAAILDQSLLADNMFFLKAIATTNTSNILSNWSELLVYSTVQADDNLEELKTYIGIQKDFYGDNLVTNYNFDLDLTGASPASNWGHAGNSVGVVKNTYEDPPSGVNVYEITTTGAFSAGTHYVRMLNNGSATFLTIGKPYRYSRYMKTISGNATVRHIHSTIANKIITSQWQQYTNDFLATSVEMRIGLAGAGVFVSDNYTIQRLYQNFYKNSP